MFRAAFPLHIVRVADACDSFTGLIEMELTALDVPVDAMVSVHGG